MRSRRFLVLALIVLTSRIRAEDGSLELPAGSEPPALEVPWFPDRAHAVVFRNWGLVDPARIARTIGTDLPTVLGAAGSMGLPPAGDGWRVMSRRGYITIVRRNWHLLPYGQLLTLLGMSAEELRFSLKEDDFLFIKLGSLKPRCAPVVYVQPDESLKERIAVFRSTLERHFPDLRASGDDPRFSFIEDLRRVPIGFQPPGPDGVLRGLRFIYSYFGSYGDPLADPSLDPYPDGLLARLAAEGVNGVWLHTALRQLAPGGAAFPEFGEGWERRLESLRELVARARRFGVGVYLYVNEPRSMPASFFAKRPELGGVRTGGSISLCTSQRAVRAWISDALAHVFREVPDLAGVFAITASENPTSCASHFRQAECTRCRERTAAEIIAEVVATIEKGVHSVRPSARVIAWDWGWNRHGDASKTIALLPDGVWLQSVSEWALPLERGGIATTVGEYSISAPGPGPRATRHWRLARERGLKTSAKVQMNATWELASVPFIPALELVAEHCERLARQGVDGTMLSWTVGGYPSPNLQVAARFARNPGANSGEVLDGIARDRYGEKAASRAREAWRAFSEAFREFPYDGSVVYNAPLQMGAANPLHARRTGYAATMVGIPYDDLDRWRGPYPREVFASQLTKVAEGWRPGLDAFREVVRLADPKRRAQALADERVARAAYVHFASVAHQSRFVMLRDRLVSGDLDPRARARLLEEIGSTIDAEIELAREQFSLCRADSRLGFEASNHYFYVPLDLVEKVLNCEHVKRVLGGS